MDCVGPKQIFQLDSETTRRLETFIYCAVGFSISLTVTTTVAMISVALYRTLRNCVPRVKKHIK